MTMNNYPIYFDYAATTPVDPRVAALMAKYLTADGDFGNPASLHVYGERSRDAVETARLQVASLIGAEPAEILFTSGATEANNLAIKGAAQLAKRKGRHIVTMKTEHRAVLDTCQHLEKEGFTVTYLAPDDHGRLDINLFRAALTDETILASIMFVNNETGVLQDLAAIAAETSSRGILLHVDAAQGVGKLPLDVKQIPIDLLSIAAHKFYGPKGVGALYLRKKPRVRVLPLFHGGGHEQGMRSGTLAVHQIIGLGAASELALQEMQRDLTHVELCQQQFMQFIQPIKNLKINAEQAARSPYILNLRLTGMLADAILANMPELALSSASACQGKGTEGSYVLRALGLTEEEAKSSLRFSFGRFTTQQDISVAASALLRVFTN